MKSRYDGRARNDHETEVTCRHSKSPQSALSDMWESAPFSGVLCGSRPPELPLWNQTASTAHGERGSVTVMPYLLALFAVIPIVICILVASASRERKEREEFVRYLERRYGDPIQHCPPKPGDRD